MKARNTYETRKKRERTMGEFLTRAISAVAVIVCLTGYNTVLDKREQAEEQIRKQNWNSQPMQQRKAQSQTVLIKTEPIPEKHRDLADRWMWK